ncbi:hypothetical protein DICPUDRAFT_155722 [Dictyostelium purpureum]|uniref:Phosphatidylinositol-3,4,5-trisphosphate 3-phosphatase n=1 Tax=Dictyostelium purpureum TaxID=5786 RepID=F0ZUQ3_DICPU|nr:uncharacterized protein DICPUDRAFT_155722 [Dictyostelium purpureum]EGC32346.1 hypothetical protein DICPUDRAFT_155722 [Dictyostelium purpureum]|eukprot:XP_003291148.1 hypothetical protein DICPUDRAFT_155722 [Dictyostelium purpureum]
MDLVRKMVSKKKRRFEWGNFDLDLSYITDRIIAMGFPSESIEGLYRNRMKDVQRFLNTLHPNHYKVYNLCSERKYEKIRFDDRVSEYPFDDHSPPNLNMIAEFCRDVESWLDQDPENVVAIHCKAGKGRTGTMIACWLLFNKQCQTGSESMRIFANKRTHNGKGVTIPSQARYKLKKGIQQQVELDCGNILLSNDVKLEFYNRNSKGYMFSYCFHTAFIEGSKIHIRRLEIDKAHKDLKHFPSNFSIELFFLDDDKDEDSSVSEESIEDKRVFNTSYATGLAKLYHHNNIIKSPDIKNNSNNNDLDSNSLSPRPRSTRDSKMSFICPKCKQAITSSDATVNRDSENYHWKCITCNRCKKTLGSNCLFEGDDTLCIECGTDSGFFKACSGCSLVIKNTDYEEFGNLIYHRSCFLCFWCHSFLADKEFIVTVSSKLLKCSSCINSNQPDQKQIQPIDNTENYQISNDPAADVTFADRKLKPSRTNEDLLSLSLSTSTKAEILNQEILKLVIEIDAASPPGLSSNLLIQDDSSSAITTPNDSLQMIEAHDLICTKCNSPIVNQRPVILDCGIWHRSCFSCYECDDSTPMDPSLYYIRNDKPICFDCDINHIVNEAQSEIVCNGCKLAIKDEEMMDALGYKWHVSCLVCETCKVPIEGQFGEHQGLIYCKDHFEVGPKCDHCNKFIDGMYLRVNGKQLHQNCFTCNSCSAVLEGGRYFEKNGESICENCRTQDILKRKTQIQLQHSLINSIRNSNDNSASITNSNSTSNSNLSNSISSLISELSSSNANPNTTKKESPGNTIEKEGLFVNKNRQLFRNSVKIRLEDLKNSGERKTFVYPSFHRHMQKQTFKTAYPTLRGRRKDFLNQLKKLENESSSPNNLNIINGFETV